MTAITERGEFSFELDGVRYVSVRTIRDTHDWRETPFGLVDFGERYVGPLRWEQEKRDD